ncbi:tRNA-specific adenosine deaminase [[Limnothrix rosea] IAM M-220]|nr:tRNA-specific adenosine deaminase [[Limnothrix rosea] IAM M-220]
MAATEPMAQAIARSRENSENGCEPFGAVIVKDSKIIATASNQVTQNNDPSAHAEIMAIRKACQVLDTTDLSGCELYTSCEPCPMCIGAIYWSSLDRIYYGCSKEDAAEVGFSDQFIYEELAKKRGDRRLPMHQKMRDEAFKVLKKRQQSKTDNKAKNE